MAKHALTFATVVHSDAPLGESTFAKAREAIEAHYGVTSDEVFLDTIKVEGTIPAGDLTLDLDALQLRYLVFGADAPFIPVQPAPVVEGLTPDYSEQMPQAVIDSVSGTITTTTVS